MLTDPVRFSVRVVRPAMFTGRGAVEVTGDSIVLTGRRRAVFGFGASTTVRHPLVDVANVECAGRVVRFVVGRTRARESLEMDTEDDAVALAGRLPATETADGAQARDEHVDFAAQLFAATPRAFVGPILIALNVGVFVLMVTRGVPVLTPATSDLIGWGANFAPLTTDGEWWRLLTAAFLHGGLLHLALNMWALYVLAPVVERVYGNAFFLVVYVFSALAGSAASILWNQHTVSVGASGAVFGVYGALLVYLVVQKGSLPGSVLHQLYASALPFVAYNLVYGFFGTGIDNAAHVGGLLGGALMGAVLARPLAAVPRQAMRWPRLSAGVVLGALVLVALLSVVPDMATVVHQERAFRAEFVWFLGEESILHGQVVETMRQHQSRAIDNGTAAHRLEPIVKRWSAAQARLTALPMDDDAPSKARHRLLVRYVGLRRSEYAALMEGLRENDRAKIDEFRRFRTAAEDVLKELNAPGARSRPK